VIESFDNEEQCVEVLEEFKKAYQQTGIDALGIICKPPPTTPTTATTTLANTTLSTKGTIDLELEDLIYPAPKLNKGSSFNINSATGSTSGRA